MRMQLRIALPARPVHEPRHHPTLRGHPPTHPLRLHPGHRRPLLQEPQRRFHRLPVRCRHHLGHRLRAQRPQQRHALRARESQVERPHRRGRDPARRSSPVTGCFPSTKARSSLGLHHPGEAQLLGPTGPPTPPATRPPRRSTRRCSTPPTRSDTPRPSTASPSTSPTTPDPITIHHPTTIPNTSPTPIPPPSPHRPSTPLPHQPNPATDTCHVFDEATTGAVTTDPSRDPARSGLGIEGLSIPTPVRQACSPESAGRPRRHPGGTSPCVAGPYMDQPHVVLPPMAPQESPLLDWSRPHPPSPAMATPPMERRGLGEPR